MLHKNKSPWYAGLFPRNTPEEWQDCFSSFPPNPHLSLQSRTLWPFSDSDRQLFGHPSRLELVTKLPSFHHLRAECSEMRKLDSFLAWQPPWSLFTGNDWSVSYSLQKKKNQRRKGNIPYARGGIDTFAGYPRVLSWEHDIAQRPGGGGQEPLSRGNSECKS